MLVALLGLATLFRRPVSDYLREKPSGSYILDLYHNVVPPSSGANAIPYSIFDPKTAWPVEDAAQRAALDETKTIPGLSARDLAGLSTAPPFHPEGWTRGGGDLHATKFSACALINRQNVAQLVPAWVYRSGANKWTTNVETNPIVVGDTLYVTTPGQLLVALGAATGKERWRLRLETPARRGLVWWAGDPATPPRLFVPCHGGVVAVDPATGAIIRTFGHRGRVGTATSLVAPAVDHGRLLIATIAPAVEAYDAATGQALWVRSLVAPDAVSPGPSGRANLLGGLPWAGFSVDADRSTLYVATGNPGPYLYGVNRPGANAYSCSIVAIDTRTGAVRWSFQEVAHDLWDFDVPSTPILVTVQRFGRSVDAVATVTKIGNTILLDRDHGRPLFDYRLRRAPTSRVPGEVTAPYQPDLAVPEPFLHTAFSASDITDLDPASHRLVERKLRGAEYGSFAPPEINRKVVTFGLHGGAEWPGGAVDPSTGALYLTSNRTPWLFRLHYHDRLPNPIRRRDRAGDRAYQSLCASCHGINRDGSYETEFTGDHCVPALVGITADRDLTTADWFQRAHEGIAGVPPVDASEVAAVAHYLAAADRISDNRRSLEVATTWQILLDDQGRPGSKPPWGRVNAIDLNTGRSLWSEPFGEYADLKARHVPPTGQLNFGGLIATQGGLLFATGTIDRKVRALDSGTGRELWEYELPAPGSAPPMTYEVDGVQYVVVVASGGMFAGFEKKADFVIAFKLKP